MNISLVQPEYLDVVWPKVSEFIKRSVDYSYGRWSVEDVYRFISEGKMVLWIAHDNNSIVAASVTIVSDYPSKKFLGIQFLGGSSMNMWKEDGLDIIKDFARKCGCDGIEVIGRKGFGKYLMENGFTMPYVTYQFLFDEE
jgi:hypothetical protein